MQQTIQEQQLPDCDFGIFSIIRGTSKADGKGALETQPELCNIFD